MSLYIQQSGSSGSGVAASSSFTLNSTWQRFTVTVTSPLQVGLTQLYLQIGGGSNFATGTSIEMWGAQMELASQAGPYVATSALPVLSGGELTNVFPASQQLNGPAWSVSNGTVTANSAPAPDGTNTAALVSAASGSTDTFINAACDAGVADFVEKGFELATQASGDDQLAYFADIGHTGMDLGSPEHVDDKGDGITWFHSRLGEDIPHMWGESTTNGNWYRIGLSIRYLVSFIFPFASR